MVLRVKKGSDIQEISVDSQKDLFYHLQKYIGQKVKGLTVTRSKYGSFMYGPGASLKETGKLYRDIASNQVPFNEITRIHLTIIG